MKFGISNNVKSRVVRECTPELLRQALDSPLVARVCAEIEDALEAVRRGEMSKDDFETLKAARKKMLPVITPHATFRSGRRTNAEAVASGLSMYDVDHIPDPRGYYDEKVRGREAELGIVLAHVTPSTEGLRLLFVIPRAGMAPDEAQRWMSARLGDAAYDGAVKDLARCSFLVPREYVLYLDEERLFGNEELRIKNEESPCGEYTWLLPQTLLLRNSSFLVLHLVRLFTVLLYFGSGIRVVHIVPFHRLNLLLQVLEGYKQCRHDEDLQNHTD